MKKDLAHIQLSAKAHHIAPTVSKPSSNAVVVFPHVGYATGNRPHLAREIVNGSTYQVPQGLTYLYSTLRSLGIDTRVVDFNFRTFAENINRITEVNPNLVLVTSTLNSYDSTRQIVLEVARSCPKARVFVGGPAVTANVPARTEILQIDAPFEFVVVRKDIFEWTQQVLGRACDLNFSSFMPNHEWMQDTYGPEYIPQLRFAIATSLGCTFNCRYCLNWQVYKTEFKNKEVVRAELADLSRTHLINV